MVPTLARVYRFTPTGANANASITVGNILNAMGSVGTVTNTTIASICSACQIKKITIWPGLPAAGGNDSDTNVVWALGIINQSDELKDQAIPSGQTVGKALVFVPPAKSLGSFIWNSGSATTELARIQCPEGSVIDIHLRGWFSNLIANVTQAVATAVLGTVYFGYLDGSTTHILKPVGLTSTF